MIRHLSNRLPASAVGTVAAAVATLTMAPPSRPTVLGAGAPLAMAMAAAEAGLDPRREQRGMS